MIKLFTKKYKWSLIMAITLILLFTFSHEMGISAIRLTFSNIFTMLGILPPILILIGLLDVWVPKDLMIRYMGDHSGIKGWLIAFFLGSFAAGPLYAAFPLAAVLLKKRARLSLVLFFLGVWSTAKLPMVVFETTSFGIVFTLIHIISNLTVFWIGARLLEKGLSKESKENVYFTASQLSES